MEAFNKIMFLFEDIKTENTTKAGKARNRNRLNEIKKLVTDAKKELMD